MSGTNVGSSLIALVASMSSGVLVAQTPQDVNSYHVNDGKDDTFQTSNGEFAPDLGGNVRFTRFLDTAASGGHRYARCWDATAAGTAFETMMRAGILDLAWLDTQADTYCTLNPPLPPTILPFPTSAYALESGPHVAQTWWTESGGSGLRSVMMWPYRLNGAAVMIVMRVNSSTGVPETNASPSILLMQYPYHFNDFQISRNHWRDDPNGEFGFEFKAPKGGWTGPATSPILAPEEQAIEAGDVVVIPQENVSENIWIALQRAQEAN